MTVDYLTELQEILKNYELGELVELEKNDRGFVNTSFAIETLKNGQRSRYFLRKYKRGIREEEIQFEHSLINHLVEAQSPPVAHLHKTVQGLTYLHRFESEGDREGVYYAIFDFLPGDDRYTWIGPNCLENELKNSAVVLAQFHNAASQFTPQGRRAEPKIMELLPVIARYLTGCPQKSKGTLFDAYLLENHDLTLQSLEEVVSILSEPEAGAMPQIVVHCDFHPGNLKFQGEQVSGLFDFDWSKIDARCFDLALAIWYCCTSWDGAQDGELRLDQVRTFLSAYQQYLCSVSGVGPLNSLESRYLPYMINAGNLYILYWTVCDFYQKEVDPQEYLVFLRHSVNFVNWFNNPVNREKLSEIAASLAG